jgi:hypothetical protein
MEELAQKNRDRPVASLGSSLGDVLWTFPPVRVHSSLLDARLPLRTWLLFRAVATAATIQKLLQNKISTMENNEPRAKTNYAHDSKTQKNE